MARELVRQGLSLLNYIDVFGGVASTESDAIQHFSLFQALLKHLRLEEVKHKACLPSQVLVWLGLRFNTINMTVSIPDDNLAQIITPWPVADVLDPQEGSQYTRAMHHTWQTVLCHTVLPPHQVLHQ